MSVRSRWTLAMLIVGPHTLAGQSMVSSVRDSIRYRFADTDERRGGRRFKDVHTGRVYVLNDTVILDGHGINSVEVRTRRVGADSLVDLIARLRPAAVDRFSAATASHVGRVLVVTIGDTIVSTGTIESRLGRVVPVMTAVRRSLADSLATRINTSPNTTKRTTGRAVRGTSNHLSLQPGHT